MRRLLLAAMLAALALPTAALAKGPSAATIHGPGLKGAIVLKGSGEDGGSPLGDLAQLSGFFPGVFETAPNPMVDRPHGDLGPKYDVVYTVPGPSTASTIRQELYPYARPYPVTHVQPGQTFWDGQKTVGGWFLAGLDLKTTLVQSGFPRRAPEAGSAGGGFRMLDHPVLVALTAIVLLILAALALARRRGLVTIGQWARRRSTSAT